MPAHKRSLDKTCPCGRWARWEVYTTRNEKLGDYCRDCADEMIVKLNEAEAKPPAGQALTKN